MDASRLASTLVECTPSHKHSHSSSTYRHATRNVPLELDLDQPGPSQWRQRSSTQRRIPYACDACQCCFPSDGMGCHEGDRRMEADEGEAVSSSFTYRSSNQSSKILPHESQQKQITSSDESESRQQISSSTSPQQPPQRRTRRRWRSIRIVAGLVLVTTSMTTTTRNTVWAAPAPASIWSLERDASKSDAWGLGTASIPQQQQRDFTAYLKQRQTVGGLECVAQQVGLTDGKVHQVNDGDWTAQPPLTATSVRVEQRQVTTSPVAGGGSASPTADVTLTLNPDGSAFTSTAGSNPSSSSTTTDNSSSSSGTSTSSTWTPTRTALLPSVSSSWESPVRSVWFARKAIFIVSIFLAIIIVLSIGAAVFLRDRSYDLEEDETDEDAIARVLAGRGQEQERKKRKKKGGGADDDEDGGDDAAGQIAEKASIGGGRKSRARGAAATSPTPGSKRPVTKWIKAAAMMPTSAALFMTGRRRKARSVGLGGETDADDDGIASLASGGRGSLDGTSGRRSTSSLARRADDSRSVSASPRASFQSRRSVAGSSLRSDTSGSPSGGGIRQRRTRRPRLGSGEERVQIEYDALETSSGSGGSGTHPATTTTAGTMSSGGASSSLLLDHPPSTTTATRRLDVDDFSAAEAAEARGAGGAPESPVDELLPPAYISTRALAPPGSSRATAAASGTAASAEAMQRALAAAGRTEHKDASQSAMDTDFSAGAPLGSPSGATDNSLSSSSPTHEGQRPVAHIATDDKAVLGALNAAASQPMGAAPVYQTAEDAAATAAGGSLPPAVAADAVVNAPAPEPDLLDQHALQPTAPPIDLDDDGFEQLESQTPALSRQSSGRPDLEADPSALGTKGKTPSLLPAPPVPHTPAFSLYALAVAPSASSAPTPAMSSRAAEKQREVDEERALLASSPADLFVSGASAASGPPVFLPAYSQASAPSAPDIMPVSSAEAMPSAPSAPMLDALESQPMSNTDTPSAPNFPGEHNAYDAHNDDEHATKHDTNTDEPLRVDQDGCPEI